MRTADVLIDIPAKGLNQTFRYAVESDDELVGCAVLVSFGRRLEVGLVLDMGESEDEDELKPIEQVLTKPLFTRDNVACARFLSTRYLAPLISCIRLFVPQGAIPRMVKRGGVRVLEEASVGEVRERWVTKGPALEGFVPRANAYKQAQVLSLVQEADVAVSELNLLVGDVSSVLKALERRDVIRIEWRRRFREGISYEQVEFDSQGASAFTLTPDQENALSTIEASMQESCGNVVLIDGVTGSGKTEVYIRSIARILEKGRDAIVLVPEIALTPQMVTRFRSRFGDAVALLHSKMSIGERFDAFEAIRAGQARVVIGPRSALFAPLHDVGLIIIDEEHETTYKQESAPRYVSRDVAQWMMERTGGTVVLGSATPSIEALYKANTSSSWRLCEMPERTNGKKRPQIEIIDMAAEFRDGEKAIFSRPLRQAIMHELSLDHKVVLLLNQRGFARFLLCRDCGFVPQCVHCSTSLTFHERENALVCHHCGYVVPAPARCPVCESPYLKRYGVGTERAEAELRAFLEASGTSEAQSAETQDEGTFASSVPIIRMDADTTAKKGAHKRLLEEFALARGAVLLGTQMIAKGLDFDDVTLVGVINADTQLHLPDFRASERTFDLIEQVAGRAGRADLPGHVMVQTYEAESLAIQAAASYDRDLFLRSELPRRRILKYPPFVRMANVLFWGAQEESVHRAASSAYERAKEMLASDDRFEVLPASPCAFSKIRNSFRWHFIVKAAPPSDISQALAPLFESTRSLPGVSMAIDIDPIDML